MLSHNNPRSMLMTFILLWVTLTAAQPVEKTLPDLLKEDDPKLLRRHASEYLMAADYSAGESTMMPRTIYLP